MDNGGYIKKGKRGHAVKQLYNQGKIKSSLLTLLYEQEGHLILIGTVVVHNTDAMNIINQLNFYSIVFGIIITLLLVAYLFQKNHYSISKATKCGKRYCQFEL
ncbi:hypothetical protein [Peribacillus simplex]|uniref:hypothetical protein n=1 Tax=Peribacillus simplex TaxID=1478 RepID=UPI003D26F8EA